MKRIISIILLVMMITSTIACSKEEESKYYPIVSVGTQLDGRYTFIYLDDEGVAHQVVNFSSTGSNSQYVLKGTENKYMFDEDGNYEVLYLVNYQEK